MKELGFPIAYREKVFLGKKFDLWFHNKKKKTVVIIESEIKGWHDYSNIEKLEEIGLPKFRWKPRPTIILFQIFSPYYSHSKPRIEEKIYCYELAKKIRKKHRKFSYQPLEIKIEYEKFDRIVNVSQKNKYYAQYRYGKLIKREINRLAKIIVEKAKTIVK